MLATRESTCDFVGRPPRSEGSGANCSSSAAGFHSRPRALITSLVPVPPTLTSSSRSASGMASKSSGLFDDHLCNSNPPALHSWISCDCASEACEMSSKPNSALST
uniref:(northern house mosquito) hypothetical protein n=1 Tax=Culex pipiens TaxID=7175 RepID=A0A8D8JAL8_CULPI